MALTTAVHVLVFTLLYVAVVLGQKGWGVTYSTQSICALKGSTVEVSCSYTFPSGTVKSTYWFINSNVNVNLIGYSDYRGRVTYRNHTNNNNTLIITDLRQSDSAQYWFRFITVKPGNQWTGTPAVTLSVTGLQVGGTPATVTEGQNVTLTCITSCPLTDNPTCIWYKKNSTFALEVHNGRELGTSDVLGGFHHPFQGLPVCHGATTKPHRGAARQNALDCAAILQRTPQCQSVPLVK
ncbi:uncharacterized protein LOC106024442 [Esox lucius]|uniref:uncharacterized protein LOC106024442 n=1 Tax=Esox lucius TaxID=8010 RepID=UPI0014775053|nr:uncharacterized protein LOC106024442 [Esox lucius]